MKVSKLIKPALVFILILLSASCAVKKETAEIDEGGAARILEKIKLYQGAVRSLKALAKVRIKTPQEKISYTQATVAERPDLLRLEALNPFGKTVGFISSDGKNIYIISPSERGVYDSDAIFDLAYIYPGLNLKITAENLVNLVLGRLPDEIYNTTSRPALSSEEGLIKLDFPSDSHGAMNYIWVNSENFRVEKADFFLDNGAAANINYEYFDTLVDGLYFPKKIEFASEGLSISIFYDPDIELNKDVNKALFTPSPELVRVEK